MKHGTSKKVSHLADGINGIYRSRRYRARRILKIVPAAILIAALIIGGLYAVFAPPPPSWDGELIVLYGNSVYINRFLFHDTFGYPEFLSSFSMTEEEFKEQANVVPIRAAQYISALDDRGILEQVDQETIRSISGNSPTDNYLILVDSDGTVLYQGTNGSAVVDILKAHGFPTGGRGQ